eukprot:m.219625 g.219625  ORF g.219625 m.219625 type:complete len:774 (+) comp33298_c0_seq1:458-2779(+)
MEHETKNSEAGAGPQVAAGLELRTKRCLDDDGTSLESRSIKSKRMDSSLQHNHESTTEKPTTRSSSRASSPSGLAINNSSERTLTKLVHEYVQSASLLNGCNTRVSMHDKTLLIFNPRVVQKSYGAEKRFFGSPPYVRLKGAGWGPSPVIFISIDEQEVIANPKQALKQIELEPDGTRTFAAIEKYLYVTNTLKRKAVSLKVRVESQGGESLGVFTSSQINVISKPSKTKFALSNMNMRIDSGQRISLYNRGSSCFLMGSATGLATTNSFWGTFTIHIHNSGALNGTQVHPNCIRYNMEVVIKCDVTQAVSEVYVVRKVDKHVVDTEAVGNDPVSQLQKIALYAKSSTRMYLTASNPRVVLQQSKISDDLIEEVSDQSIWTIASADVKEFTFCDSLISTQKDSSPFPIYPVPYVRQVQFSVVKTNIATNTMELRGENFSKDLQIWFDNIAAKTTYHSATHMQCELPPSSMFFSHAEEPQSKTVRIMMVREDGVIYHSQFAYTYDTISGPSNKAILNLTQPFGLQSSMPSQPTLKQLPLQPLHHELDHMQKPPLPTLKEPQQHPHPHQYQYQHQHQLQHLQYQQLQQLQLQQQQLLQHQQQQPQIVLQQYVQQQLLQGLQQQYHLHQNQLYSLHQPLIGAPRQTELGAISTTHIASHATSASEHAIKNVQAGDHDEHTTNTPVYQQPPQQPYHQQPHQLLQQHVEAAAGGRMPPPLIPLQQPDHQPFVQPPPVVSVVSVPALTPSSTQLVQVYPQQLQFVGYANHYPYQGLHQQ